MADTGSYQAGLEDAKSLLLRFERLYGAAEAYLLEIFPVSLDHQFTGDAQVLEWKELTDIPTDKFIPALAEYLRQAGIGVDHPAAFIDHQNSFRGDFQKHPDLLFGLVKGRDVPQCLEPPDYPARRVGYHGGVHRHRDLPGFAGHDDATRPGHGRLPFHGPLYYAITSPALRRSQQFTAGFLVHDLTRLIPRKP